MLQIINTLYQTNPELTYRIVLTIGISMLIVAVLMAYVGLRLIFKK